MKKIEIDSLYVLFSNIPDFRDTRGKKHKIMDIFILTFFGLMLGHTSMEGIAYYLKLEEKYFTKLLNLENGIPSHDTFLRVFNKIDVATFMDCFIRALEQQEIKYGDHIAIDGKAIRAATKKANYGSIPYIVCAFDTKKLIALSQIRVEDKKSEVTTIPKLIKQINIEDKVVTIDAIGCNKEISTLIHKKKGYYILALKGNQKTLDKAANDIYSSMELKEYITMKKEHGRFDKRTHSVVKITDSYKEYINELGWDSIVTIGRIIRQRQVKGEAATETTTYYISNKEITAEQLAEYVINHWKIENNLHWILDEYFREDRSTSNTENVLENLSIMRKMVYNMMNLVAKDRKKSKTKLFIDLRHDLKKIEALVFDSLKKTSQ